MTRSVCQEHFIEIVLDNMQAKNIEMVVPLENCTEECEIEGCTKKVEKKIFGKGESTKLGLPTRKQYIVQMHKELQVAIEIGCVLEFSAAERFLPNAPQLTEYKFLVNKEQLIKEINTMEQGK